MTDVRPPHAHRDLEVTVRAFGWREDVLAHIQSALAYLDEEHAYRVVVNIEQTPPNMVPMRPDELPF